MLLSVIIVSYNVKHYLRQCLDSVWRSAESAAIAVEVFVVDNHSSDNSVELIRNDFPQHLAGKVPNVHLHLIANQRNVGFGRANNQALRKSKGDYILFLNPDTIVTERTFSDCLKVATATERLGAIGVKMLRTNGTFAFESRRGLPTPWTAFCKMTGLGALFPKSRYFGRYYLRYLDPEQVSQIEIVSGAFMFCSRKALEACGAFDEDFFMYGEDIDLSYRFIKGGFQNLYVPTPILHYKGESTHKNTYRYVHVFYQAMLIFFKKHYPTSSYALIIPVHLAIYAQAIATLVRQYAYAFGRYLYPSRHRRPVEMHYVGAETSFPHLKEKQETWGIDLTCSTTIPAHSKASIITFSIEDFSYEEILRALEFSDHRSHLGLYSSQSEILILGSDIYS